MCPAAQGDADPLASLCEGGGSAKRWRRERFHTVFSPPVGCADSPLPEGASQRGTAALTGRRRRRPLRSLYGKPACPFVGGDAHIAPPREIAFRRRDTRVPPYRVRRSCGADRVVRRDRISAGTRAVEHQGTHRGSGQRRATAHRGKLWRHNPLNREKPGNRLRVGQVSAKSQPTRVRKS